MSLPSFLRFTPVPLRARHDGWSPELQFRFILLLARGHSPGEAARRLGKSRQTAYALRTKPGAEGFAAAWDAALDFAKAARQAAGSARLLRYGEDAMLVPRFYRGRLVGFVQREDHKAALRTLGQLDRVSERLERSGFDLAAQYEALEAFDRLTAEAGKADRNRA